MSTAHWPAISASASCVLVVFVVLTYFYNRKNNNRARDKRVQWRTVSDEYLLTTILDKRWTFAVSREARTLDRPRQVQIDFSHIGATEIESGDIDTALAVEVVKGEIVECTVEHRNAGSSLMQPLPETLLTRTKNRVEVAKRAINPDEVYRFNLLVAGTDSPVQRQFHASGCTESVAEPGHFDETVRLTRKRLYLAVLGAALVGVATTVLLYAVL